MPLLLVVHHSPTRSGRALLEAVVAGAEDPAITGIEVRVRPALATSAEDLLAAEGYVLGTPANFGYMSGALKHCFDSTFLAIGGALADDGSAGDSAGRTARRPYGLFVHGRYDTTGAVRSVQSIVSALGWRQSAPILEILGDVGEDARRDAYELGATIAAVVAESHSR
jgi:multimeric flavodoxin WrbA